MLETVGYIGAALFVVILVAFGFDVGKNRGRDNQDV